MADFTQITDRVFTGAALGSMDDVEALSQAGITHVIDCRDDFDDSALIAQWMQTNNHKMNLLWNGTPDDGVRKPPTWFDKSLYFALHALSSKKRKVYAHCAAGVNRGPSTAYAILRVATGLHGDDVFKLLQEKRPQVQVIYRNDADYALQRWL